MALPRCDTWPHAVKTPIRRTPTVDAVAYQTLLGRLQAQGVSRVDGNHSSAPWCTVGNPGRFFSYRRDGVSGRMAACIWLAA